MAGLKHAEGVVQTMLWAKFGPASAMMLPNYTPGEWWECDAWRRMSSGYTIEYEIKLTAADFRADAKKHMIMRRSSGRVCSSSHFKDFDKHPELADHFDKVLKHDLLADGDLRGPNRFFYVTPHDLEVDIPEWAGHIRIARTEEFLRSDELGSIIAFGAVSEKKKAPLLHQRKDESEMGHVSKTLMYRYWRQKIDLTRSKLHLQRAVAEKNEWKKKANLNQTKNE